MRSIPLRTHESLALSNLRLVRSTAALVELTLRCFLGTCGVPRTPRTSHGTQDKTRQLRPARTARTWGSVAALAVLYGPDPENASRSKHSAALIYGSLALSFGYVMEPTRPVRTVSKGRRRTRRNDAHSSVGMARVLGFIEQAALRVRSRRASCGRTFGWTRRRGSLRMWSQCRGGC